MIPITQPMSADALKDLVNPAENKNGSADAYLFKFFIQKAKETSDMKQMFGTFFQSGEFSCLFGKTGVGKSTLAYQITDCLSRGLSCLEQPNEMPPQKVLYLDFELREPQIKKRFSNFEPNLNFYRPDMTDFLLETSGKFDFSIIAELTLKVSANIVVVDNLTALVMKDLQDQSDTLRLMKEALMFIRSTGCSVLLLSHTPKLKEARPIDIYDLSGSANISNFLDSCFYIGKSAQMPQRRYIKSVKNRNSAENDEVLEVDIVNDGWLHFEFAGIGKESDHLVLNIEKEEKKKKDLTDIAKSVFGSDGSDSMHYNDFCFKYSQEYGKSFETGKKIHSQLKHLNLIIREPGGSKWLINRNEIAF